MSMSSPLSGLAILSPPACHVTVLSPPPLIPSFLRISKEENDAYVASLDQEEAELEKALASSADEHARLVAAKQSQEMMLVEHLTALNISPAARGERSISLVHIPRDTAL